MKLAMSQQRYCWASMADMRAKTPEYTDLNDEEFADAIYKKFYSDMTRERFDAKIENAEKGTPDIVEAVHERIWRSGKTCY